MQERHRNREAYFKQQHTTTTNYVIPYISRFKTIGTDSAVLEIGCGIGGNLSPFIELGCKVTGVELNPKLAEMCRNFLGTKFPEADPNIISEDMYNVSVDDIGRFDIIFMKDVIEHIHNQSKFLGYLKSFLKPGGVIFFAFPPWRMPFGGHQQVCNSNILNKAPYFHLLPNFAYVGILKMFGEKQRTINNLLEVKETGIGISDFQRIVKANDYEMVQEDLYLINPNYEAKFNLKPRPQIAALKNMPYVRDFFTTCMYALIKNNESV